MSEPTQLGLGLDWTSIRAREDLGNVLQITVIELWPKWTECHNCETDTPARWGLPVDEFGDYVSNDYAGEWGGVPSCRTCYDLHAANDFAGLRERRASCRESRTSTSSSRI